MINYFTIRIRLLVAILAATLPLSVAKADGNDKVKSNSQGWYVGIKGGVPFSASLRFQVLDTIKHVLVGLPVYMEATVSIRYSRQSCPPNMER